MKSLKISSLVFVSLFASEAFCFISSPAVTLTKDEETVLENYRRVKNEEISYSSHVGYSAGTYSIYMLGDDGLGEMSLDGDTRTVSLDSGITVGDFIYTAAVSRSFIKINQSDLLDNYSEKLYLDKYYLDLGYRVFSTSLNLELGIRELPGAYLNSNNQVGVDKVALPHFKLKYLESVTERFQIGASSSYMFGSSSSRIGILNAYTYGLDTLVGIYRNNDNGFEIKGSFNIERNITKELYSTDKSTQMIFGLQLGF